MRNIFLFLIEYIHIFYIPMDKCKCFYNLYKGEPRKNCSCFNNDIGREYICPKGSVTPGSNNIGKLVICQKGGADANTNANTNTNPSNTCLYGCGIEFNDNIRPEPYCNPPGFIESFTLCPEKDITGPYNFNLSELGYTVKPNPPYLANPYNVPDQMGGANCPRPGYETAFTSHSKSNYNQVCCGTVRCTNGDVAKNYPYPPGDCGLQISYKVPQTYNKFRSYGSDEVPGFYFDLAAPGIGNRPVYGQTNKDFVPRMLLVNEPNLEGRCFDCTQPYWGPKCV